jgi:hypothetical protein
MNRHLQVQAVPAARAAGPWILPLPRTGTKSAARSKPTRTVNFYIRLLWPALQFVKIIVETRAASGSCPRVDRSYQIEQIARGEQISADASRAGGLNV